MKRTERARLTLFYMEYLVDFQQCDPQSDTMQDERVGDGESNAHSLYCTHIYINLGGMTGTQRASALIMKI